MKPAAAATAAFYFLLVTTPFLSGEPFQEPPLVGDATSATRRPFSLNEALDVAERSHPSLQLGIDRIAGAAANIRTAGAYANPQVSVGAFGWQRVITPGNVSGRLYTATISQDIPLPSVRNARISVAELGRTSTQYALEEDQLNVRGFVKQTFFEAIRRRNEIRLAAENLQLLSDLNRRIKVQYDVGEAPLLELKRAETEVSVATVQAQSAERRYAAAMANLHAAVGTALGDVEPTAALYPEMMLPPLQNLIDEVLAKHPGIAAAENETRRADALINLEKKLKIPQPNAWVNIIQQPDVAQYWYGISIPIPIFNRREGQIAEAEAARRQAASFASYRKLQLTTAVEAAFGEYRVAQSQVDMFEDGIVLQAQAAVDAAQAAFQFGERGIIEVLDAQRVLRTARLEYMNAQYDRQQALIALEQLGALDLTRSNP
jgi:cobalt-zinc-cadmium efflux system outer membrane protein